MYTSIEFENNDNTLKQSHTQKNQNEVDIHVKKQKMYEVLSDLCPV